MHCYGVTKDVTNVGLSLVGPAKVHSIWLKCNWYKYQLLYTSISYRLKCTIQFFLFVSLYCTPIQLFFKTLKKLDQVLNSPRCLCIYIIKILTQMLVINIHYYIHSYAGDSYIFKFTKMLEIPTFLYSLTWWWFLHYNFHSDAGNSNIVSFNHMLVILTLLNSLGCWWFLHYYIHSDTGNSNIIIFTQILVFPTLSYSIICWWFLHYFIHSDAGDSYI